MRVFITGGNGFLGRRIAGCLAARGDQVIVFDPVSATFDKGVKNITPFVGDVTEMAHLTDAFFGADVDAVIHCAAIVGVLASIKSPRKLIEVNVQGTLNVLEAMRIFSVKRMIHISSNEVYGDAETTCVGEDHPLRPQLPYGISKVAVEQLGRTYGDLHGVECINLRGSWIYAPDLPRPRLPNVMVTRAYNGEEVRFPNGAKSLMDYVHADDFVTAVLASLDKPEHSYDAYNIGSGTSTSLPELASLVQQLIPGARISVGPGRYEFQPGLPMRSQGVLDISRAEQELGYAPKYELQSGINDLIRAGRSPAN